MIATGGKSYMSLTASLNGLIVAVLVASSSAQERPIKKAQLPPAVRAAVDAQSQGTTVRGFSEEKEHGKTFYEAELLVDGHSRDVLMDAEGNTVEVEEEVAVDALPAAVRDSLQAKAGVGKIVKVESLTKHGKLVAYEAQVLNKGKKSEIQVGPNGSALDHEE
jgi:uncharacterized membrane protein YkoI